ncbi:MAG TPA: DUF4097 family beta strand repeat-containing protein [Gemmatimonadales bacterium]
MMRNHLLVAAALAAGLAPSASAQRGRRDTTTRQRTTGSGTSSDYRFTPTLRAGQRLDLSNIDGSITVTQSRGTATEIVVHKIVRRGNGDLVKAVMEETAAGVRVCAVYLNRSGDGDGCDGHHGRNNERSEPLDVDLNFEVGIPPGVELGVRSVDGSVVARGIDTPASIHTVDGDITFDGVAPDGLNTVDGKISVTITNAKWDHDVTLRSVDGDVDVTLSPGLSVAITGETVDGNVHADFPVTLAGKWGPRSFRATVGDGSSRELRIHTVDGSIRLHRGGS